MKNINGQGNEITIILPHKKIDCISSHHEQFNQIIHQSHIIITETTIMFPCISIQNRMLKNYFLTKVFY